MTSTHHRLPTTPSMQTWNVVVQRDVMIELGQAINANHQYPDGFMLFLGTMIAPTQDRRGAGQGFTHEVGDRVCVSTPRLGTLVNRVRHSCDVAPWTYGIAALMRQLGAGR